MKAHTHTHAHTHTRTHAHTHTRTHAHTHTRTHAHTQRTPTAWSQHALTCLPVPKAASPASPGTATSLSGMAQRGSEHTCPSASRCFLYRAALAATSATCAGGPKMNTLHSRQRGSPRPLSPRNDTLLAGWKRGNARTHAHTGTHWHTLAHTGTHRHTQAHTGTHRHTQAHTSTHTYC